MIDNLYVNCLFILVFLYVPYHKLKKHDYFGWIANHERSKDEGSQTLMW